MEPIVAIWPTVLKRREQAPEPKEGWEEKRREEKSRSWPLEAEVPGPRPRSVGNEQMSKEHTDNLHEACDATLTEGSRWGGRLSSFVVRKPRLCTVTLYFMAGELCTLSTSLQLSVSLCKI